LIATAYEPSGRAYLSQESDEWTAAPSSTGLAPTELRVAAIAEEEDKRRLLASTLRRGGLRVVCAAAEPEDVAARCRGNRLDAVVLAFDGLRRKQVAQLRSVQASLPGVRIIGVAPSASRRQIQDAVQEGADGFVVESRLEEVLALAVRSACAGQLSLPVELRGHVGKPTLSVREKQILGMVVLGFSNGEIAAKLHLAESTVKSHLSSAFVKLGVRSRNEATALILDAEGGLGTGILAISGDQERIGGTRSRSHSITAGEGL
jgi:DNA-binding NarL/FixJ family response regulator